MTYGSRGRITVVQEPVDGCSDYGGAMAIQNKRLIHFKNNCQNNLNTYCFMEEF